MLTEDRPFLVVQVEHGERADQVLMCLEEGVDGTHVAPVVLVAVGGSGDIVELEVVNAGLAAGHEVGNDVASHVVARIGAFAVAEDSLDQRFRVENIVAHGREDLVRGVGQADGVLRLLPEITDAVRRPGVDLDDAELVGQADRLTDGRDGRRGSGSYVSLDHLAEVHPIHVVGSDDDDDVGLLIVDQVETLQDRVRGSAEPAFSEALLRRHRGDVRVEQATGNVPCLGDVTVQAVRFVLGEHHNLGETRIDQVR